jgi:hypothetical protein
MKVSGDTIYRKERGWPFSAVIIGGFLVTTIVGFFFSGWERFQDPGTPFDWIYRTCTTR